MSDDLATRLNSALGSKPTKKDNVVRPGGASAKKPQQPSQQKKKFPTKRRILSVLEGTVRVRVRDPCVFGRGHLISLAKHRRSTKGSSGSRAARGESIDSSCTLACC